MTSPHDLSDIFHSDTSPPSSPPSSISHPSSPPSVSTSSPSSAFALSPSPIINPDINRLQSTHQTAGYRDGISSSKASFLQQGFDEGYALGAELGLRVGFILGALEGMVTASGVASASLSPASVSTAADVAVTVTATAGRRETSREGENEGMRKILNEARRELVLEEVFKKECWGENGVWRFDVEPPEGGEITFPVVADEHPLLKRWLKRLREEMNRVGIGEGRFEGEEWERGRVGEYNEIGDLV